MGTETYIIYAVAGILLIISFFKSKEKTYKGLKKGLKSFMKLMPILLPMLLFIGILLTIVSPEFISTLLGEESGVLGIVFGLIVGSITFMPSFVAFPLGAELLNSGGAYPQVAGFLVSLMSVGIVYYAAESKYFSKKSAIMRNLVSFIGAVIVVLIVLVIY